MNINTTSNVVTQASSSDPFDPDEIERLVRSHGSPLLILDLERVLEQYRQLKSALPNVILHYALKPCPHHSVVATLRDAGACFDIASSREIDLLRSIGVPAGRCIHTHPVKCEGEILQALAYGIKSFVVDNPEEILKFTAFRERVELMVRVAFRNPDAVWDLSAKFGCEPDAALDLIRLASEQGISVHGLAFHVGSQAMTPHKHVEGIRVCADLMMRARAAGADKLNVLDMGGGFPAQYTDSVPAIDEFCAPIRNELNALPQNIRVIAEPGRYIVAPAITGATTVVGKARRQSQWWYYVDDGVYGSFSGNLYDHAKYPIECLHPREPRALSVIAGPTCDSIDIVRENLMLPSLNIGDLIVGRMMGAYTWTSASDFNFLRRARIVVVDSDRASVRDRRVLVKDVVWP